MLSRSRRRSKRRLGRLLLFLLACLVADEGLSLLLERGWLNHALTARLEAAFGRPVKVGHYDFSLIEGPRLEADRITVAEDPRFGNEYFLRADQLAVGFRWSALLRGRLKLGTLSFSHPSLNLVRLPDGGWNLEAWLPPPGKTAAGRSARGRAMLPLRRIEVSSGRIDFKEGPDKLPFAFVDVNGSVEQDSPGSWRLDLEARPMRAAVVVQQAGTLRLRGRVGGTSSRLRPAALELEWEDASLSDVLRLARGYDYGVRGLFSLVLTAHTEGPAWDFSAHSEFRRMHRWDLVLRPDAPAANLNFQARWEPAQSRLELTRAVLEAPRSRVQATGSMEWAAGEGSAQEGIQDADLEISSEDIQAADLLAWLRAFHRGVGEQLTAKGAARIEMALDGWPLRIGQGLVETDGLQLSGGNLPATIRIGRAVAKVSRTSASLAPVALDFGSGSADFQIRAELQWQPRWASTWALDGRATQVEALFDSAAAFGWKLPPGWSVDGPAVAHLHWNGAPWPDVREPTGRVVAEGIKVRAPFLNRAITQIKGTAELRSSGTQITLASAEGFGTHWKGTFARGALPAGWRFSLVAGALSATEMDRWLNPQRRVSLLERVFPFLAPAQPEPAPVNLRGSGHLLIGRFRLAPLTFRQLSAGATINGRKLRLDNTQARLYGGTLDGSIALNLTAQPDYHVRANFRGVDLGRVSGQTRSLADLFAGKATGEIEITAKGLGRQAILGGLGCRGAAEIRQAQFRGMDLVASLNAGTGRPGITAFPQAFADFSCSGGRVHFSKLRLISQRIELAAAGDIDFQRRLNLEIRELPAAISTKNKPGHSADSPGTFWMTGTLSAPRIARIGKARRAK